MRQVLTIMTISNTLELDGDEEEIAKVDEYLLRALRDKSECLLEFNLNGEDFRIAKAHYTGHHCPSRKTRKKLVNEDKGSSNGIYGETFSSRGIQGEIVSQKKQTDDHVKRVISEDNMRINAFSYDNGESQKPKRRIIEEADDSDPFLGL